MTVTHARVEGAGRNAARVVRAPWWRDTISRSRLERRAPVERTGAASSSRASRATTRLAIRAAKLCAWLLPPLLMTACAASSRTVVTDAPPCSAEAARSGCSAAQADGRLPFLQLPPASLGRSLSLNQRLGFSIPGKESADSRTVDAMLEVEAPTLKLAVLAFGRRVYGLTWDGQKLEEQRSVGVPAELQGPTVARDIQLVFWPFEAIRAALPEGWTLEDSERRRAILREGTTVVEVEYPEGAPAGNRWLGRVVLSQRAEGYTLMIDSREADDAS